MFPAHCKRLLTAVMLMACLASGTHAQGQTVRTETVATGLQNPWGLAFLTSERYGKSWQGNLFVGSLKFGYLDRIELSEPFGGKVIRESKLLTEVGDRIRDVRQGPDGLLYVLTDSRDGKLIRLLPN